MTPENTQATPPSLVIDEREWLEPDGCGGFASGTVSGVRTRRYHGLLLTATTPPTGRMMLVNGVEAWIESGDRRFPLSSHRYAEGIIHPDGASRLVAFTHEPWPRWEYHTDEGSVVVQELYVRHGHAASVMTWTLTGPVSARLVVRPLLSGRDYHALHHENPDFNFTPHVQGQTVSWTPYAGVPGVQVATNGVYRHDPLWYRQFEYSLEQARGLDSLEDLASPGDWSWTLSPGQRATCVFSETGDETPMAEDDADALGETIRRAEVTRRAAFTTPLDRAADAYVVRRGGGKSLLAGYPWFTDWGRDTFIGLRGLTLATGRLAEARDMLLEWTDHLSDGMLPNRFPDAGHDAEFNAVDASLWFIVAAFELQQAAGRKRSALPASARARLHETTEAIVRGYVEGTRFGIRCDTDGLLMAGADRMQLTWMDAKIGDHVVTPRRGKPVEVNALWVNALRIAGLRQPRWHALFEQAQTTFRSRFWNAATESLFDVVDVDGVPGATDASIRPNQIFAVGGLPVPVVETTMARRIVDVVERTLLTPMGLRSLAPGESGYAPRYEGDGVARDLAYHQGTVWPWLMGPFVEAWLRTRPAGSDHRAEARARFLAPLMESLESAGLGHVSEITDAEAPFTARGCPFQAWSLGELIRLDRVVLARRA